VEAFKPPGSKGIVMSLVEELALLLRGMALGELALALFAVLAYSIAINGSYTGATRSAAASLAFAAAVGFTTLTPSWMSAIVFLGLAIVAIAAFAAFAWLLSSLLGLGGVSVAVPVSGEASVASMPNPPARGFAAHTSAQAL
jgi:hypothetical protein